ncbi:MAG: cobyrinate a,c-diamide synthase [Hydrogenophilus sp.]
MVTSRFYLSALRQSSGKTLVSIGLAAALRARHLRVQTFKKGPDYIDAAWLALASRRPCYHLDPYLAGFPETLRQFTAQANGTDVAFVEGNKGLHDGMALDGSDSNAALAVALDLPVVLVVDVKGMTRGVAPWLFGVLHFAPKVRCAGVVLNRVAGSRHEAKVRAAIDHYLGIPVLGALPHLPTAAAIDERYLGLTPACEDEAAEARVEALRAWLEAGVDLDALLAATQIDDAMPATAPAWAIDAPRDVAAEAIHCSPPFVKVHKRCRLGVRFRLAYPYDKAFSFYYDEDLQRFADLGVELVPFDATTARRLPACDALWLGGGFPERAAAALSANRALRSEITAACRDGLPTYAECGGLIYLAAELRVGDAIYPMCGLFPAEVSLRARPVGRGYVALRPLPDHPWRQAVRDLLETPFLAHEFHYSALRWLGEAPPRFAWLVERGYGIDGRHDGLVAFRTLASYVHLRNLPHWRWTDAFLSASVDAAIAATLA